MEYSGFKIIGDGIYGMKVITRVGAGAVPKELGGLFSNCAVAQTAIDQYLLVRNENKNAKTTSSNRG
jgi:hypothetical protein